MKFPVIALLTALCFLNRASADTGGYTFTTIDAPVNSPFLAGGTFLTGISASGQIIGYYTNGYSEQSGFVYTKGVFAPIKVPGLHLAGR